MKAVRFKTTLLAAERSGGAYIPIDDATRDTLGGDGRIPVRATFNGIEYRGSVCKMGGVCGLGVTLAIRSAAGIEPGDMVTVMLERDTAPRTVEVPDDLAALLAKSRGVKAVFDRLSFTHQKEYVQWIEAAKRPETRKARIARTLEMLRST